MNKLLTEQELLIEIQNIDLKNGDFLKNFVTPKAIKDLLALIQSQKQAHADMVIGRDATGDEIMADAYGIFEAQDDLRDEQRKRNRL